MSSRYEIASVNKGLFNRDILANSVSAVNKQQAQNIINHFKKSKKQNPYLLSRQQLRDLSEDDTIEYYVNPILKELGFISRKKHSDKNKKFPDIWLFSAEPDKTTPEYFQHHNLSIVEAKAYNVDLDKGDGRDEKPAEQILKYITTNTESNPLKKWGILTNGFKWRLYSIDGVEKYIEFDIDHALEDLYELEIFCAIFSNDSFRIQRGGKDSLSDLREKSLDSWVKITTEIEGRGNEILLELTKGFYEQKLGLVESKNLAYETLFKLLYILYIESKNLIPRGNVSYATQGLRTLLHEIYILTLNEYDISNRLSDLFELYCSGGKGIPKQFGGEHFFANNKIKIKNKYLKSSLELLTVFERDKLDNKFFDYSSLNVELVGNIYESTMSLEFKEHDKTVDFKIIKKKKGTEVHSTGTTYTPSNVVKYLIEESFPKTFDKIPLICDPACGSGHFLVQALRYLSDKVSFDVTEAATLQEHKRKIAQVSLHGTDINGLAAKLARLMLALETADKGSAALDFRPNIKNFNALLTKWNESTDWIWKFENLKKNKILAFDYVVGNPPYVRADEPGQAENRKAIKDSGQFKFLNMKWDLFMPFIELAEGLVKSNNGIVAFVVSDGITYAPYSLTLTESLSKKEVVKFVSHFSEAFESWAFPATCFVLDLNHKGQALKRIHDGNDPSDYSSEKFVDNAFLTDGKEKIKDYFDNWKGLVVEDLFYVSKGMVLHRNEKYNKKPKEKSKIKATAKINEEPECPFADFKKEDLIIYADEPTKKNSVRYLETEDLGNGVLTNKRLKFIEFGNGSRLEYVSRPTFNQLHNGERILLSRSKQGFSCALVSKDMIVSDNTIVIKQWAKLSKVKNRATESKLGSLAEKFKLEEPGTINELVETLSPVCSEKLLLGIFMSDFYLNWIRNDERHKHNVVPDVISEMPIPVPVQSSKVQFPEEEYDMLFKIKLDDLQSKYSTANQDEIIFHIESIVTKIISNKKGLNRGVLGGYLNTLIELFYRPVTDRSKAQAFLQANTVSEVTKTHKLLHDLKGLQQKQSAGKKKAKTGT
jgi:type I restriction-modification system DNA methylase subunit